jgi:2-alkyl-3-oxoalkanoate reductase
VVLARMLRYEGRMTTYLVTGATGFVGGALVARLLRERETAVRALVREAEAVRRLPPGAQAVVASLGDPNALAEAARSVHVVFHCAGENDPRASSRALAWINVAGTENLINAARRAQVRRVVHLSCADVTLVNADRMGWKETRALTQTPLDACTRSKLLAEELALQANGSGLEVCALRPAWVWGAGDRRTLPALYAEARRGRVSLCGSGKNFVPTTHVDNLVEALLLAAHAKAAPGGTYHVLDGEMVDARELLSRLCQALGVAPPRRGVYLVSYLAAVARAQLGHADGLWPAEVVRRGRRNLFDGTAAARDLKYQPKTSLEDGLQGLGAWLQELGGPEALLAQRRQPASELDADVLVRLAEAHTLSAAEQPTHAASQ